MSADKNEDPSSLPQELQEMFVSLHGRAREQIRDFLEYGAAKNPLVARDKQAASYLLELGFIMGAYDVLIALAQAESHDCDEEHDLQKPDMEALEQMLRKGFNPS